MFDYEILRNEGIAVVKFVGTITFDDYQKIAPSLLKDIRENSVPNVLFDYRQFSGWENELAEDIAFVTWREVRTLFSRLAIVCPAGGKNKIEEIVELWQNTGREVRLFSSAQYDLALEWLRT
jgi:hypothetical protein